MWEADSRSVAITSQLLQTSSDFTEHNFLKQIDNETSFLQAKFALSLSLWKKHTTVNIRGVHKIEHIFDFKLKTKSFFPKVSFQILQNKNKKISLDDLYFGKNFASYLSNEKKRGNKIKPLGLLQVEKSLCYPFIVILFLLPGSGSSALDFLTFLSWLAA